jgi:hypothetical protein
MMTQEDSFTHDVEDKHENEWVYERPVDEPVFDEEFGIWIHDPYECREFFSNTLIPPNVEWRRVIAAAEIHLTVNVGEYVLVGYDGIYVHRRSCNAEVEWAIRCEEDGWSCHAIYEIEGAYTCVPMNHTPIYDTRYCDQLFEPLRPMGPLAPRRYKTPFAMDKILGILVHDPHHLLHHPTNHTHAQYGKATSIPRASEAFWKHVLDYVDFSMTAYHSPKEGDTVLIHEHRHFSFSFKTLYVTVRYMAMLQGGKWVPCMTIQLEGEEFIGYDYEWTADVSPVYPPPSL